MPQSLVSVIIPVYNSEDTIHDCLNSVINQSHSNLEILVVDDGSKDSSLKLLREFEKVDSRIQVLCNVKNTGLPQTLNDTILNHSTGDLVARMDADDISHPLRIEKQLEYLQDNPEVGLLGTSFQVMGLVQALDKRISLPELHDDIFADLKKNKICHPSVLFKKDIFKKVGGYRNFFVNSEDFDLWLRMSEVTRVANHPESLIRYRLSNNGISVTKKKQMLLYHQIAVQSFKKKQSSLDEIKSYLDSINELASDSKEDELRILIDYLILGHWKSFIKTYKFYTKKTFFLSSFSYFMIFLKLSKRKLLSKLVYSRDNLEH